MNFVHTSLFEFIFKVIAVAVFLGLCIVLVRSAIASFKTSHKWTSVIDEIAIGVLAIFGFMIVMAVPPATIFNWCSAPIVFFWNLLTTFLRETLNVPL